MIQRGYLVCCARAGVVCNAAFHAAESSGNAGRRGVLELENPDLAGEKERRFAIRKLLKLDS